MQPVEMSFRRSFLLCLVLCLCACGSSNPAPVINYGLQGGATSAGVHTVANGDTLWSIAQRYRVDMKDIVYVNHLKAPYFLEIGNRLNLPPPLTYRVREGDTLYDISRTFDISMTQLAQQNNMKQPYRIRSGDILRLPSVRPAYQENRNIRIARPVQKPDGPPVAIRPVEKVTKSLPVKSGAPPRSSKDGKFIWPVEGAILSSYGPKKDGLHNDGINIRAVRGTPIRAAENGVVVYADNRLGGFGNLVLVRHEDRWMTAYGHLDKTLVQRGQEIKRGQTVGTVGQTGAVDSPQLHFEVRRGTEALNPQLYLGRQGS